jgi:hypothetical protein
MTTSSSSDASSTAEGNSTSSHDKPFPLGAYEGFVIAGILIVGIAGIAIILFCTAGIAGILVVGSCILAGCRTLLARLSRPPTPILSNGTSNSPIAPTSQFTAPSTRLKQPPLVTSPPTYASPPNHSSFSRPVSPLSATLPPASQAQNQEPSEQEKDLNSGLWGKICPKPTCIKRVVWVPGAEGDCGMLMCTLLHSLS